ncbi:AsmA family protein [Skermanella mucosa]|uniref:AsmA family protein n=1 Tax=Skermanella mucosa TaxID=1789672 RepID=UPI00192AA1C2|nr:AsmA family protein [Skermanella mucosa]UEM22636.1 AsmA family protein [Skermanella mucosa]
MRKFLIGLALVAVVLVAVVVAVPFLVPVEQYKGRIEAEVAQRTGREFRIQGPMSLSLLPTLAIELNDVSFAGPPGARTPEMVRLGQLELELKPWPLLRGEVQVDTLVLREPRIALEVDAQGRPNWVLDQSPAADQPAPAGPGDGQEQTAGVPDIRLGEVELVDGRVSYFDARTQALHEVTDVDVTLMAPDLARPADLKGRLVYRERPVTVETRIEQPRALIETGASGLTAAVNGDLLSIRFDGALERAAAGPGATGTLDLRAPELRQLATWVTGTDPGDLPVQSASVAGGLAANADRIALTGGTYKAGDMEATGNVAVALAGARPKIEGVLNVARLNLDRYLNQPRTAGSAAPAQPTPAAPAAAPGPAPSPAGDAGWSTRPIDFSALRTVDADLKVALAGLTVKGVDVGASDMAMTLDGGRLRTVLGETALFDGTVSGQVNADASAAVPALALDLRINGVQAEPVLTRFADFNRLAGTARAVASLRTTGASERAMVEGLNGQGSVTFTDGAIKGINLAAMVRNAAAAFQGQPVGNEPQQTDFAELGGNFTIQNGVVRNDDLRLLAPLLRLEGRGTVALPSKTIDYRLQPRLVSTIEGQGGTRDVTGIAVPVLVRGSLTDPSFAPDLAGLAEEALRNPEAIREQIEGLKGKKPEEAVRGLIEGLTGGQNAAPGQGSSDPAQQLRGLFGR